MGFRRDSVNNRFAKELRGWILSIIAAAIIAFVIKALLFDIIEISGPSMVPTLHDFDRVAIEKLCTYTGNYKRGEVIILDPGSKGEGIYIKRIIALPGELLEIKEGKVYIDGSLLEEDYLQEFTYTDIDTRITVPEDCVFVMGDNRRVSEDSRRIGPIPIKNIKGHALFRLYPFDHMGKI